MVLEFIPVMDDDGQRRGFLEFNAFLAGRSKAMIHPRLREVQSYWNSLRAARDVPFRSEIDPRALRSDLPHLFILERVSARNIRFRVAGTALSDAFGMELRGLNARMIMASVAARSFTALLEEVMDDPATGYARLTDWTNETWVWEMNLLPLRSELGAVDRVLGCLQPLTDGQDGDSRRPLQMRIESMSVDPISLGALLPEFAETPEPFVYDGSVNRRRRPSLISIDGGGAGSERTPPTRGHLKLIED